ncbi:MAG: FAD-binding oxidoreductase [Pseudomonadota bacterium]
MDTTPSQASYDVVIIGGAMYGSAVAWFLADNPDFDGSILVVEKDPSYRLSSTAHTNSCIRQQFSTEINVRVSQFGAEYINNFRSYMGDDPRVPDIPIDSFGYLYLADNAAFADVLKSNQQVQAKCGAATEIMTVEQIRQQYPFYQLDDIVAGSHNRVNEGYFDGGTVFDWWRKGAREKGAQFIENEVVDLNLNQAGSQVEQVVLRSEETIMCGKVVNASGPRAKLTAAMAGIELPVEPRKRYTFIFSAVQPLDCPLPLTIDPSGVHVRSDGGNYLAGCPPDSDPAVDYDDFIEDHSLWQDKVWPAIANRIPQFSALKLINSWVGHYAYNTLDQNAILGAHPKVENFIFVNGFSGHGLQQSPAMGRGTAELITYGEYRSLDLTPFEFSRITEDRPFVEKAVI